MKAGKGDDILEMLKAVADKSRLALLRLLHDGEHTVGDLARSVDLGEPTVSHHLSLLREAGFVTLRMAGNQRFYRVNDAGLAKFKKLAAEIELPVAPAQPDESDNQWIEALGWDAQDQQVLREYTFNARIVRLPSKQGRMLVILRWLATLFQPDILYTEPQVNAILKAVYETDHVSLRRDLVDMGYLRRERGGGKYWLAPAEEGQKTQTGG